MQVRAHKVRKNRRLDPECLQLEFDDPNIVTAEEPAMAPTRRRSNCAWNEEPAPSAPPIGTSDIPERQASEPESRVAVEQPIQAEPEIRSGAPKSYMELVAERPPLAPFPRINGPVPKIIEFPRTQLRQYELADPVADQLRIFEAEELPPPRATHLSTIEIAPEEPVHAVADKLEVPIQAARLGLRAYANAVDGAVMICALVIFAFAAQFFASSIPISKPVLASGAICTLILLTFYYLLSFSFRRNTIGIEAAGLQLVTFSGDAPTRTRLRWRALATVLSYAALGMGFAWSLIDEDRLCWHDRITHTYPTSNK